MSSNTYSDYDVICGRGRTTFLHAGNKRFRLVIEYHLEAYSHAPTRLDKSKVVTAICDEVRSKGDFIRQTKDGQWVEVTERIAREKCGQGLRDCLHDRYRSSTHAKQVRRKNDLEEQSAQMAEIIQSNTEIRSVLDQLKRDLKVRDDLTDDIVLVMFTTANSRILEELKASKIILPTTEGDFALSTPQVACCDPVHRPPMRQVSDEHYPRRLSSSSAMKILTILDQHMVQV